MPKRLQVPLSDEEMAALDAVRGDVSRAQFVRRATLAAVWELAADQEPIDPVENWRKARGL